MTFVLENLRLRDLVAIVRQNQAFYTEFLAFLKVEGYSDIHGFVNEKNNKRALQMLAKYLASTSTAQLYDGLGQPYKDTIAKWYFIAWMLRDAPAQRLAPLLQSIDGHSLDKKKAFLLNEVRKFVGPLFPEAIRWEWPVLSEVMLARLEGSRRALKGARFEEIVRGEMRELFKKQKIALTVGEGETRINEETYDVQVSNGKDTILVPVKTRETMGGGHANLFTRDIFKSISVAQQGGYQCVPIIIAESWAGNLDSLKCHHLIYLKTNPNQTDEVQKLLAAKLTELVPLWKAFAKGKT